MSRGCNGLGPVRRVGGPVSVSALRQSLQAYVIEGNWTCEGARKPLPHLYTATPSPCENGPILRPVIWCGIDEGIFLTRLKFAFTGSRTQDLRSAAETL